MLRNSGLAIRMVTILLFAVIGHELLMIGAHASTHVEQHSHYASHEAHRPAVESGQPSIHLAGHNDAGDCAPGHEFVRRVDESTTIREPVVSVTAVAPTPAGESRLRLASGEIPGMPPGRQRALLQVFLN